MYFKIIVTILIVAYVAPCTSFLKIGKVIDKIKHKWENRHGKLLENHPLQPESPAPVPGPAFIPIALQPELIQQLEKSEVEPLDSAASTKQAELQQSKNVKLDRVSDLTTPEAAPLGSKSESELKSDLDLKSDVKQESDMSLRVAESGQHLQLEPENKSGPVPGGETSSDDYKEFYIKDCASDPETTNECFSMFNTYKIDANEHVNSNEEIWKILQEDLNWESFVLNLPLKNIKIQQITQNYRPLGKVTPEPVPSKRTVINVRIGEIFVPALLLESFTVDGLYSVALMPAAGENLPGDLFVVETKKEGDSFSGAPIAVAKNISNQLISDFLREMHESEAVNNGVGAPMNVNGDAGNTMYAAPPAAVSMTTATPAISVY